MIRDRDGEVSKPLNWYLNEGYPIEEFEPYLGELKQAFLQQLIIFNHGAFLDSKLRPLDRAGMAAMTEPVLAVPPDLSLAQVLAVKARLALAGLTVTILDKHWLAAIKEHEK